jgi:hypothetical protein
MEARSDTVFPPGLGHLMGDQIESVCVDAGAYPMASVGLYTSAASAERG